MKIPPPPLFPHRNKQVRAGPRDAKEEWEKRLKEVIRKSGKRDWEREGLSFRLFLFLCLFFFYKKRPKNDKRKKKNQKPEKKTKTFFLRSSRPSSRTSR